MSEERPADPPGFGPLAIVLGVALMGGVAVFVGAALEWGAEGLQYPQPPSFAAEAGPIESEASVFRLTGEDALAVSPGFEGNGRGHVRSMEIYRRLRAYPGAPPRIPHGLTADEFEGARCNGCHERGGWVARFGSYAPVTPHPEYVACLQCHVPSDPLVGVALPTTADAEVCDQCHLDPDASPESYVTLDWQPASWPVGDVQAMEGSPHAIPHGVESRNNCIACHGGPGSVVSLRTDHPERTNCRQCHVPIDPGVPSWPTAGDGEIGGGSP